MGLIEYFKYSNLLKKETQEKQIKQFLFYIDSDYFYNFINKEFFNNSLKLNKDRDLIEKIYNDFLEIYIIYLDNLKQNKKDLKFLQKLNKKYVKKTYSKEYVINFNNITF